VSGGGPTPAGRGDYGRPDGRIRRIAADAPLPAPRELKSSSRLNSLRRRRGASLCRSVFTIFSYEPSPERSAVVLLQGRHLVFLVVCSG
jgi:hypothetical protein